MSNTLIKDSSKYFNLWYSDNAKYGRILNNREYFQSKGITSELVFMSPQEYLESCAKGFRCSLAQSNSMVDKNKVKKYISMLASGHKFPCPILSYNNVKHSFLQEGRHRAQAAMEFGLDKIPVWIITSNSNVNDSLESIPLLDNEIQILSRINNTWREVNSGNPGFIRNWNFVSKSKAKQLLDLVNSISLNK